MRRTAIVTGASRGLGSALARALAADGWNLVVDARGAADLARATDHIAAAGPGSVEAIPGDIADPRHVATLVDAAESAGPLTLLVNNAGTLGPSPLPPLASVPAVEGYEGWGAYGASKAAFEQLSRVLAAEEPTVRVFWVDPGDMNTRMHQDAFPGEDISDRPDPSTRAPAIVRLVAERPPSGRYRVDDLLAARPTGASGPAAELQEARS